MAPDIREYINKCDKEGDNGQVCSGGDNVVMSCGGDDQNMRKSADTDDKCERDDREQGGDDDKKCLVINKTRCQTRNCDMKSVLVTSTRWRWIERKKCFGSIRSNKKRWICPLRNKGLVASKNVPSNG